MKIPQLPEAFSVNNNNQLSSNLTFEEKLQSSHELIDQIFSTDLAGHYTPEYKSTMKEVLSLGTLPSFKNMHPLPLPKVAAEGRILPTQVNNIFGWRVGLPINCRNQWGGTPTWKTVRERFWKNEYFYFDPKNNPMKYTSRDLKRMKKGLPPQRYNDLAGKWESKELHHNPAQRDGGIFDVVQVWPDEHAKLDNFRHIGY